MAFKRALVVDDSKSARHSLAKLLAQHDLEVAFAESGEAALAFLQHELVDVIFMDHTMPGMDGLEAVSAIKANARTATIPVMMYTTKEGEVYVGQARALGAVGVLPKQVQPGVLFDMLKKLGLVTDQRDPHAVPPSDAPRRRITDIADAVEQEYEQRALGVSVQTLVTRILEEQHLKLRSEILASHRRFAHQVAEEILESPGTAAAPESPGRTNWPLPTLRPSLLAAGALAGALLALTMFTWHVMSEREAAKLEIARMTMASRNELDAMYRRNDGLSTAVRDEQDAALARSQAGVDALQWALNHGAPIPFDQAPFGDAAAETLAGLMERLRAMGFRGNVTLTAHLAPFCLGRDAIGSLQPLTDERSTADCELIGHPLDGTVSLGALQTLHFANVLNEVADDEDIIISLQQASAAGTLPDDTAAEWNRAAGDLNRVSYTLEAAADSAADADSVADSEGGPGRTAAKRG